MVAEMGRPREGVRERCAIRAHDGCGGSQRQAPSACAVCTGSGGTPRREAIYPVLFSCLPVKTMALSSSSPSSAEETSRAGRAPERRDRAQEAASEPQPDATRVAETGAPTRTRVRTPLESAHPVSPARTGPFRRLFESAPFSSSSPASASSLLLSFRTPSSETSRGRSSGGSSIGWSIAGGSRPGRSPLRGEGTPRGSIRPQPGEQRVSVSSSAPRRERPFSSSSKRCCRPRGHAPSSSYLE